MDNLNSLIQIRRQKHANLNNSTYPVSTAKKYSISEILFDFRILTFPSNQDLLLPDTKKPELVSTAGRIKLFRKSGGIAFLTLEDSTGEIQLIVTKSSFDKFDLIKNFDLGDIVEVTGYPCYSKTQEKSLFLTNLTLLTKAISPPPEKWDGISDPNNNRVLDLMSNKDSRMKFRIRAEVLKALREYLDSNSYLEVETPVLQSTASGANAKPFETHHNALDKNMFLRIAPELSLKKLLVGGLDRVFEIGKNFRNEGLSTRHNPEFTMVEWYGAYLTLDDQLEFTKKLLIHIDNHLNLHSNSDIKTFYQTAREKHSFFLGSSTTVTMLQAVNTAMSKAGVEFNLEDKSITWSVKEVNSRFDKIKYEEFSKELDNNPIMSQGEFLNLCFEYFAEPFLTEDYRVGNKSLPVFIIDFPKDISPLARAKDNDPNFCDRFELYLEGREVANAFQELNDPEEQLLRFTQQAESNQKDKMSVDNSYVETLRYGLPPCSGVGVGLDRLIMSLLNCSSIRDIILFPAQS